MSAECQRFPAGLACGPGWPRPEEYRAAPRSDCWRRSRLVPDPWRLHGTASSGLTAGVVAEAAAVTAKPARTNKGLANIPRLPTTGRPFSTKPSTRLDQAAPRAGCPSLLLPCFSCCTHPGPRRPDGRASRKSASLRTWWPAPTTKLVVSKDEAIYAPPSRLWRWRLASCAPRHKRIVPLPMGWPPSTRQAPRSVLGAPSSAQTLWTTDPLPAPAERRRLAGRRGGNCQSVSARSGAPASIAGASARFRRHRER
jgi:hypothetical protein